MEQVHIVSFEMRMPYTNARGSHRMRWSIGMAAYDDIQEADLVRQHNSASKEYRNVKLTTLVVNHKHQQEDATAPGGVYPVNASGALWPVFRRPDTSTDGEYPVTGDDLHR